MRLPLRTAWTVILLATVACRGNEPSSDALAAAAPAQRDSIARARSDSFNRAQPGYVIDSIFPPAEELRRFRAAFPGDSATAFEGGSPSRDALVRRFVRALVASDTADLLAMQVHGREFADLYFPDSPYSHPPYQQPPSIAWRLIQDPSSKGLTKLLRRVAGHRMTVLGEQCDPKVLREGATTRYAGCLVRLRDETGATMTKRYFGSILERGGQFKFLSYTNDF